MGQVYIWAVSQNPTAELLLSAEIYESCFDLCNPPLMWMMTTPPTDAAFKSPGGMRAVQMQRPVRKGHKWDAFRGAPRNG